MLEVPDNFSIFLDFDARAYLDNLCRNMDGMPPE